MKDQFKVNICGHVMIRDTESSEILFDKFNAIHPQNIALIIAKALSRDTVVTPGIFSLCFGNGGTFYNSSSLLVYRPPNTIGSSATLYNQTYSVQVDDQSIGTPTTNSVGFSSSISPAITSLVTIIAQLNANEPAGQASADNITTNPNSLFTFDEIGLKSADGLLLSHLIFNPIEKTANRAFTIVYDLTISVS